MTQEQKEKAYDEALKKARKLCSYPTTNFQSDLEEIFPELKESEDEKIKKAIISYIDFESQRGGEWFGVKVNDIIAWLEKQGEPRQITHEEICKCYGIPDIGEFSDGYHTFNGLYKQRMILFAVLVKTYKNKAWKSWKHEDGELCFGGGWFIVGIDTPAGTYTYHYEARDWDRFDCQILEKGKHWDGHDESDVERLFTLVKNDKTFDYENADVQQKDFAPKPEPKFKVGDWITDGYVGGQITSIEDNYPCYKIADFMGGINLTIPLTTQDEFHLWTIQDANDGDVLAYVTDEEDLWIMIYWSLYKPYEGHVHYHALLVNDNFSDKGTCCICINDLKPATKEQCDILFQKMKESGYEWDEMNKKLIKIEQKPTDKVEPKFKVGDWIVN